MIISNFNPRQCSHCAKEFMPSMSTQQVCSPRCALRKVRADKAAEKAADRAMTRKRREDAKPRAKWLAECQAIVNKMVRLRDADRGCISCDRPASWGGQWHASHLRSVGAASSVRFHLWNISKACSVCNNYLSGNLSSYLPRARERWGDARVDWLYGQNGRAEYTVEYLKRFKAVMGKRLKRMELKCNAQ